MLDGVMDKNANSVWEGPNWKKRNFLVAPTNGKKRYLGAGYQKKKQEDIQ
ncbi:MAG: hypothetical protein ABIK97_03950 [candidate division WOR-3 bacterium]